MTIHNNPRTTPYSRAEIVRRVMGISERAVAKWLARFRAEGEAGMTDRSSRPHAMPSATPADVVEQVIALRLQRLRGKQIAKGLGLSPVTATRVVTDNGSCYKSFAFRDVCKALGLKHIRTRTYTSKPMAGRNASSRPACANGPMPASTQRQSTEKPLSNLGSTIITGTADAAA